MKNKSFTLIELLVVIVIIGILAGVIMISTSSAIDKANIAKVKVFEESVQNNLAANMVSAWDADHVTKDTTWTLNDKWGNNNGTFYDGTVTTCSSSTCPQIVNDKQMGNVLYFDGINDYIDCNNTFSSLVNKSKTFSAWVKFENITTEQRILNIGYNNALTAFAIGIAKTTANKAFVQYRKGTTATKESISLLNKNWHLITAVQNNTNLYLYIDGVLENSDTNIDIVTYISASTAKIGKYFDTSSNLFFNGLINDIRIYNAALSSSQIKQNYIAGLNSMFANGNMSKQEYNERINNLSIK